MFCSKCGKENSDDAKFCVSCGSEINNFSESFEGDSVVGIKQGANMQIESKGSPLFAILGWIFNAISLLFVPILFAAGGFIFGYLHRKVNHTHGTIIMIAAVACGLFGVVLGMAFSGL
ncbi:zinc-ribbon domain-containing protein [Sedimentibacter sp.]|uniref:zinc-ribbon domain-containing protein n=1 Tax=Sedimentibacter sp. TaxID=1960295 RepID=UPI0028A5C395|nr:zinc-ribbon domain-containing protein [Sedimentibacter sp.]